MQELLKEELKKRGWQSGTYRGFLRQFRGGIEWEVGVGRSGRLEIRWRYKTENGDRSGEESLTENAGRAEIEDAMTSIYLRVHERPDPTRVFGGGKRQRPAATSPAVTNSVTKNEVSTTAPADNTDEQPAFDL